MLYTINELRRTVFPEIYEVYDVFVNHFGEDYTDLQGVLSDETIAGTIEDYETEDGRYEISDAAVNSLKTIFRADVHRAYIYVWWPRVTITNENDRSISITDLYAKITIERDGTIPYECRGFQLNRSSYTMEQWTHKHNNGYMHSHICNIPKNDLTAFQNPCLGTGPINQTICSLKNNSDEVTWMLFCQELSMYVTVESLRGGPYNRLEEVGKSDADYNHCGYSFRSKNSFNSDLRGFYNSFSPETFKDFVLYYLDKGHLKISYREGRYGCSMPYYDFIIDISNTFIGYFNEHFRGYSVRTLLEQRVICKVIAADGKFYKSDRLNNDDVSDYNGRLVLKFKGRDIRLSIEEAPDFHPVITYLLDNQIAMHILQNVLKVINYRYKNEHVSKERGEDTTSAYQNVRYI